MSAGSPFLVVRASCQAATHSIGVSGDPSFSGISPTTSLVKHKELIHVGSRL
jgi:hypothetical protein